MKIWVPQEDSDAEGKSIAAAWILFSVFLLWAVAFNAHPRPSIVSTLILGFVSLNSAAGVAATLNVLFGRHTFAATVGLLILLRVVRIWL